MFLSFYTDDGTNKIELEKGVAANFLGFSSYGLLVDQKDWNDGSGNYAERVFIWGNTAFQINNEAKFVIERNPNPGLGSPFTMRLENFFLEPRRENQGQGNYRPENFDFKSSDGSTEITQTVSERAIDPSGIGRTVLLEFTEGGLFGQTYSHDDFLEDRAKTENFYSNFETNIGNWNLLASGVQQIFNDLFTDGITTTLVEDKLVVFGTSSGDILNSYITNRGHDVTEETADVDPIFYSFDLPQHEKTGNGFVFVGGAGADTLIGGDKADSLFGGADSDKLLGGVAGSQLGGTNVLDTFFQPTASYFDDEIQDRLEGGNGSDEYYFFQRFDVVSDQRNWWSPGDASGGYSFFDVVLTSPVDTNSDPQKMDVSLYQNVDIISDSDGSGAIFSKVIDYSFDNFTNSVRLEHDIVEFSNSFYESQTTHGLSYYVGDQGKLLYLDENTGKLYGFTFYTGAEFGADIQAHWTGYHASFVIENFSWGDFNIRTTGAPIRGTEGDDQPNLQQGPNGEGANYSGEGGDDVIVGTATHDKLDGGDGNDTVDAGDGNDEVSGGEGNDVLAGGSGADTVFGSAGNDMVRGDAGDDMLFGDQGDDTLVGGTGRDYLGGGSGDDTLLGGVGSDRYAYFRQDGNDVIEDIGAAAEQDVLELFNIPEGDIALSKAGTGLTDLQIDLVTTGQSVLVKNQFAADVNGTNTALERIELKSWDQSGNLVTLASWDAQTIETLANGGTSNSAPVVSNPLALQSNLEDTAWSFTVPSGSFTDADGDVLSYSATLGNGSALPSWLTFNPATQTFAGTPPQDFNGTLTLKVIASDGQASAESNFNLVINPVNDAPVVVTGLTEQTSPEDTAWSFTVPSGTFTDADGDALSYTATLSDGSALPSWLTFNAATQTFAGTPPQDFNGTLTLKVTASDGQASADSNFSLIIDPVNDAPVVATAIADQTGSEGTAWSFTVPETSFADVDGDTLAFSATLADGSALPAWLTFDAASRTFSGTPPQGSAGQVAVTVSATDGLLAAEDSFVLTVETGASVITGTNGNETLNGTAGDDQIFGLDGDDILIGGLGADTLDGGEGWDGAAYWSASSAVTVNLTDSIQNTGAARGDTYTNIEAIFGTAYNDSLTRGADTGWLFGGNGDDVLNGMGGNDTLIGETGNDTFVFSGDFGWDTIDDFEAGVGAGDVIHIEGSYSTFADLIAASSQTNDGTSITAGSDRGIFLVNVDLASLVEDDFSFASVPGSVITGTTGH